MNEQSAADVQELFTIPKKQETAIVQRNLKSSRNFNQSQHKNHLVPKLHPAKLQTWAFCSGFWHHDIGIKFLGPMQYEVGSLWNRHPTEALINQEPGAYEARSNILGPLSCSSSHCAQGFCGVSECSVV